MDVSVLEDLLVTCGNLWLYSVVCYFLFSVHIAHALISYFLIFFSPCIKGKVTITAKPGTKLEIPDRAVIADKVIYAADCLKNLVHRFKKILVHGA